MTPLLEARGLRKLYTLAPARPKGLAGLVSRGTPRLLHAVDGVSLALHRGQALGLVGESGCGKSTLAQMLVRLVDPTEGAILLEGRDITAVPAAEFARSPDRRRIQMVFQDATDALNPRDTVFSAIADPARRLIPGLSARALRELVHETAARVNLPDSLLTRYPHQLSGGQRARVGIARAIVVAPEILVLDEPTSALDVSIQAVILKLLDRLRAETGMAYVFVSHDLNVVRMLCERVMVMYLGRLVEEGPAEPVFRAPRHPYTAALIDAIPQMGRARSRREGLEGEPQSPVNPSPAMCRLVGRCRHEGAGCRSATPELQPEGGDHRAACFHPLGG
jgi:oligopeptide/dipeptide ABC transporter ATP-binding protein